MGRFRMNQDNFDKAAGASVLPQGILDSLTDVAMPRLSGEPPAKEALVAQGMQICVREYEALVVGSGAAGLRAAVELKRRGIDVAVATQSAFGGTSACSGSDKQTLHTANVAGRGDNLVDMASAIGAGGSMDEDTAYVEAVGSVRALSSLQFLGLPSPQDRLGGVLRYQTDHDEVGRATSCGPRTSRLMVKVLLEEALRLGIPVFNHTTAVRILITKEPVRRAAGVLAVSQSYRSEANPHALIAIMCSSLVIAAGGPGELYRDSAYPRNCFGSLGMALEAGMETVNLTESQFGISTSREGFPWALSGTYSQSMPCIYSVDEHGHEHNFLAEYFRTTQELASNIFRKGYQWPFHATRMLEFKSSLIDLAVFREMAAGRKVYMDFLRNPMAVPGDKPFDLSRVDEDVRQYLANTGAVLPTPIERLRQMNPLSIELYKRYKMDVTQAPLECSLNNQHMNGGISVDTWAQTSLPGCYAIGEAAGTHGVTRPGGAALNAGQVFGTRCAEHIAASAKQAAPADSREELIANAVCAVLDVLKPDSPITTDRLKEEIQARMSENAGVICHEYQVASSLQQARELNDQISKQGICCGTGAFDSVRALQWRHNALASEAVLAALNFFIEQGGGSRGARAICSPKGSQVPATRSGTLEEFRFIPERINDRREQILVRRDQHRLAIWTRPIRLRDTKQEPVFERNWPEYLTGQIFHMR
jgi:succinate dehydrogenase / fumarate reductase flavoprotein subunit